MIAPTAALTLWPEWAWAIAWLDKRVENRSWPFPARYQGRTIAIHAGTHIGGRRGSVARREGLDAVALTAEGAGWLVEDDPSRRFADGSVLGLARHHREPEREAVAQPILVQSIVAVATLEGCRRTAARDPSAEPSPWAAGPWEWHLADVRRLPSPVSGVRGAQGLWTLPPHVRAQVAAQLEAAA